MIIGIIVYACFLLFTDVASIKGIIMTVKLSHVSYLLGLVAVSYGLRFYRWQSYLKEIDSQVSWRDSLRIFFCGIAMAVTPGKAGELIKSYILHKNHGVRYCDSIPVVLAERITDLMAILFVTCLTVLNSSFIPQSSLLSGIIIATLCATFLGWPVFAFLLRKVERYSFAEKYCRKFQSTITSLDTLFRYPFMLKMFAVSLASWFVQCMAAFLIFILIDVHVAISDVILIVSVSTLAGALSMLPAGIGIFEGSMLTILSLANIDSASAVAATILLRIFILWSGVITGSVVLQLSIKRLKLTEV